MVSGLRGAAVDDGEGQWFCRPKTNQQPDSTRAAGPGPVCLSLTGEPAVKITGDGSQTEM